MCAEQYSHYKKIIQLICSTNQLAGFSIMALLVGSCFSVFYK